MTTSMCWGGRQLSWTALSLLCALPVIRHASSRRLSWVALPARIPCHEARGRWHCALDPWRLHFALDPRGSRHVVHNAGSKASLADVGGERSPGPWPCASEAGGAGAAPQNACPRSVGGGPCGWGHSLVSCWVRRRCDGMGQRVYPWPAGGICFFRFFFRGGRRRLKAVL